jgi:type VI protein secretion system component Hcp
MAGEFYLKIEGVEGEIVVANHEKEIQIQSYGFGASQFSTAAVGGGLTAGKCDLQSFNFNVERGKASPQIFNKLTKGAHIPKATLYELKVKIYLFRTICFKGRWVEETQWIQLHSISPRLPSIILNRRKTERLR